jgi:putative DNA methylase
MERRFIEESFPVKEISKISAKEKSLRFGYISTFHHWWTRKPLAVSRGITYASLIKIKPNSENEYKTKNEFLVKLCQWSNATNSLIIDKARKNILNSFDNQKPIILDPFSGGGSIPFESLRLGCETYAMDYNPVASIILKCTLEYPQKYSSENISKKSKFGKNLVTDTQQWGEWVLNEVKSEIEEFYHNKEDIDSLVCYVWARVIHCQNKKCGIQLPLFTQYWLASGKSKNISLYPYLKNKKIIFKIIGDGYEKIPKDFDPSKGNISNGIVTCLACGYRTDKKAIKEIFANKKSSQELIAVVSYRDGKQGKKYRISDESDRKIFLKSEKFLEEKKQSMIKQLGFSATPDEPTPKSGGKGAERGFTIRNYYLNSWEDLFNSRQLLSLITFTEKIREAYKKMIQEGYDQEYAKVITTYLGLGLDRLADYNSTLCRLNYTGGRGVTDTFARQALSLIWNYAETNPFNPKAASWIVACKKTKKWIEHASLIKNSANTECASATSLRHPDKKFDAVFTDPPYYDMVPYSYLSDFFYVWLKRSIGNLYPDLFSTPLTPKPDEIVTYTYDSDWKDAKETFEKLLKQSFKEIFRVLKINGIAVIVYAHQSTDGWETLINSLLESGLVVTAAWPINTEMKGRKKAQDTAALASSIYMVTRKLKREPIGFYRDVKKELKKYLNKKLEQLWSEGFSGTDFFIASIGSAIEVFGKYEKVVDDSDAKIKSIKLLNDTRKIVTDYAINKVIKGDFSDEISPLTRFYILWRWAYGEAKVPSDDSSKMAQSVGIDLEHEWGKGFIMKEKEFFRVIGPHERTEKNLADRHDMIDELHRILFLWKNEKREVLEKFLKKQGYSNNNAFKLVAQAISQTLVKESIEKKWLDGFLTSFKLEDSQGEVQSKLSLGEDKK